MLLTAMYLANYFQFFKLDLHFFKSPRYPPYVAINCAEDWTATVDEKSDSAEKNTDPGKYLTDEEEKDLTDEEEKDLIAHVKEIDLDADREEKDRRHANSRDNIYIAGSGPS